MRGFVFFGVSLQIVRSDLPQMGCVCCVKVYVCLYDIFDGRSLWLLEVVGLVRDCHHIIVGTWWGLFWWFIYAVILGK